MIYSISAIKDSQNFICYPRVGLVHEAVEQIEDALRNGFSQEQINVQFDSESEDELE